MSPTLALFAFFQVEPENVSWWLPHSAVRDAFWLGVLALNLIVLLWVLHKLLFRGKSWSIPMALRDRGQGIRAKIDAAERAHREAQERLAAIETRIANLPAEVAALQAEAELEAQREYQRLLDESRREADRLIHVGKQEIESAAKLAQKELKGLAAGLALDLATQRIQDKLTTELDQAVVRQAIASMQLKGGERPN